MYYTKIFPNIELSEKLFFPPIRVRSFLFYCKLLLLLSLRADIIAKNKSIPRSENPHIVFDDRLSRCSVQYFSRLLKRRLLAMPFTPPSPDSYYVLQHFLQLILQIDLWYRVVSSTGCCRFFFRGSLEGVVGSFLYTVIRGLRFSICNSCWNDLFHAYWDGMGRVWLYAHTFEVFELLQCVFWRALGYRLSICVQLTPFAIDVCTRGNYPFTLENFVIFLCRCS